jgi:xanthine/uracil permease
MFAVMGVVLVIAGVTGATLAPRFQSALGDWIERTVAPVIGGLGWIPDPVIGLALVGVAVGAVMISARHRRSDAEEAAVNELDERKCHEPAHH